MIAAAASVGDALRTVAPIVGRQVVVARDEDEGNASRLGNVGGGGEKTLVCARRSVVALVLVDVAETEHDARLGHEVGCCSKRNLLRAIVAHGEDVVHDARQVTGRSAVVAALVGVAVGDEDSTEPHVLGEKESIGSVVVSEDLQLVVVDGGGRGVGGDLAGVNSLAVHLHGGDETRKVGARRQSDCGQTLCVALGHTIVGDPAEGERHLRPCRHQQGQQADDCECSLHGVRK